jgi:hypothetical protein
MVRACATCPYEAAVVAWVSCHSADHNFEGNNRIDSQAACEAEKNKDKAKEAKSLDHKRHEECLDTDTEEETRDQYLMPAVRREGHSRFGRCSRIRQ